MFKPHRPLVALLILAMLQCSLAPFAAAWAHSPSADLTQCTVANCCDHQDADGDHGGLALQSNEISLPDSSGPAHRQCLCKGVVGTAVVRPSDVRIEPMTISLVPLVEQPAIALFAQISAPGPGHVRHFPPLISGRLVRALCGSLVI